MNNFSNISKKSGIYKLTHKILGLCYIGKANNLYRRILDHTNKQRITIDKIIAKDGFHNFKIEILHWYDNHIENIELLALEAAFIEFYNATNPNFGYNKCKSGADRTGIPQSNEAKLKISKSKIGKKHPLTEQTKQKMSKASVKRPIKQIDKYTKKVIKIWASAKEVYLTLKIPNPNICHACNGRLKSAGGYKWEYLS